MALHLPIGPLKNPVMGWSRYRDANPVPISPLPNDLATASSRPVLQFSFFAICCLEKKEQAHLNIFRFSLISVFRFHLFLFAEGEKYQHI